MYPSPASPEGSSTRQSTRNDQLSVIFNVLGAPDARTIETARTEEVRDVVDALPAYVAWAAWYDTWPGLVPL